MNTHRHILFCIGLMVSCLHAAESQQTDADVLKTQKIQDIKALLTTMSLKEVMGVEVQISRFINEPRVIEDNVMVYTKAALIEKPSKQQFDFIKSTGGMYVPCLEQGYWFKDAENAVLHSDVARRHMQFVQLQKQSTDEKKNDKTTSS